MVRTFALAGTLVLALAAAAEAQVPTPVNPRPDYPIATNGTPLPFRDFAGPGYGPTAYSGRSVGIDAPVLGPVGGPVGGLLNGGLGLAGTALNGVGTATGAVVGGVLGQR